MIKLLLIIAFDGTNYSGWQTQQNAVTVQQHIDASLRKLFKGVDRVYGSSRTDSGVHALAMAAHVEIPEEEFRMSPSKLRLALNTFLPADIRVMDIEQVSPRFHAQYDAKGKQYRYQIWNHRAMNPLFLNKAWHVPQILDRSAMRRACRYFLGTKDFKSFAAHHTYEIESTIRTVSVCRIKTGSSLISIIIEGDGFLYKMCRGMVGTLIQVGQGKYAPEDIEEMFNKRDRRCAGMSAPAEGLYLWKVFY